jgi:hypothetical protein
MKINGKKVVTPDVTKTLKMVLPFMLFVIGGVAPTDYDAAIAEAHAGAARNREQLLQSQWHWAGGAPVLPVGCQADDICHSRPCKHCGCQIGHPPCPTPPANPHDYPGCPNQVQCGAMQAAQATLWRDDNATDTAAANGWLAANFANTSSDWWRMTFGNTGWSGPPLENAYSVAAFAMFNSRSRWVTAGQVAPLSAAAESGMLQFWFTFVQHCAQLYPGEAAGDPQRLHDSENIDSVRHTGCYFGASSLAHFPTYASKVLPDNSTVAETAAAWEDFTYRWLAARALNGFFDELGSSGYWTRTWPCVWAIYTLSAPASRVRRRAKMFIDLALLEAELSSINGVRAGQKSRDKKATCPTCSKHGCNPALERHAYTALTPLLYGDDLNGPVGRLYQAPIATQHLGGDDYAMSNVSVLVHRFGAAPATRGVFTMKNRMMGQVSAANASTCSQERCAETFRPYPCACEGGGSAWHTLLPHSRQLHVVSRTPEWALAAVAFSPNDAFVANSQQRGTGLTFGNGAHSAVALPHLTGEKWGILDQDVMLVQRCGSCNYGGPSLFQVYNASAVWQQGGWWFMTAGGDDGAGAGAATGWAAMRPAWGGTNFTNATAPGAAAGALLSGTINLLDTWAPLLLVAASARTYGGSLDNFTRQVLAAPLAVGANRSHVSFAWHGRAFGFTPGPSTWKGRWTLPTLDGTPVDVDPPFTYNSPHMRAALDSQVVTASYDEDYTLVYNFSDDSITRA